MILSYLGELLKSRKTGCWRFSTVLEIGLKLSIDKNVWSVWQRGPIWVTLCQEVFPHTQIKLRHNHLAEANKLEEFSVFPWVLWLLPQMYPEIHYSAIVRLLTELTRGCAPTHKTKQKTIQQLCWMASRKAESSAALLGNWYINRPISSAAGWPLTHASGWQAGQWST